MTDRGAKTCAACSHQRHLTGACACGCNYPYHPEPQRDGAAAPAYGDLVLEQAKRQNTALERIAIAVEMLALPGTHEDPDRHLTNLCTQCPTFVCESCHELRPSCVGDADSDPDWCDDCVDHAKESPPG